MEYSMREQIDSLFLTVITLLTLFLAFYLGQELSERKHCIKNGGHYSFDYGECINEKK